MVPLSKQLLEYFQCTADESSELQKKLNSKLAEICKPCWELKYCPYGAMVEEFPLPPITVKEHNKHIEYLKDCLQTGKMGENHDVPLTELRKKLFQEEIQSDTNELYIEKLSNFEKEASCSEFGHLCPAFFVSEPFTETTSCRNRSRKTLQMRL